MNRRFSTISSAAVLALGFLALGADLSRAADSKVIPGGLCFSGGGGFVQERGWRSLQ